MSARLLLGLVEIGSRLPDLGTAIFNKCELRSAGRCRCVDDRVEADPLRGPGRPPPVFSRRGGYDRAGAVGRIALENGKRAAPLERAELVDVLALEEELPPREGGLPERGRRHSRDR